MTDAMAGTPDKWAGDTFLPNIRAFTAYRIFATETYPAVRAIIQQIVASGLSYLRDDMMISDGGKAKRDACRVPRVEVELAFMLDAPLKGPDEGLVDVLRATDYAAPAIEIVDARIQDRGVYSIRSSDNGAAASVVVGGRPARPSDIDLRWTMCILYRNAEIEETGLAASVLGDPSSRRGVVGE
jgi:2-oxo-hept-3-ene-1,7-dioate hydratase